MFKFICFITVLNNSGLTGDDFKYIYTNKNMVLDFCNCKISRRCGSVFFASEIQANSCGVFFLLFTFMNILQENVAVLGMGSV